MAIKGMFDDELILGGVITEIVNDYVAGYDTSEFGSTDAVTVIGTAFNGPVGIPVPVFSPEYAKYMFGEAFDPITRREASLIPEIYDVWDKGCRTIYAVRLSGKDMYKDYELAIESEFMLRVSGQFPCNDNKDCFMLYKAKQGGNEVGVIRIYKPADRTTVQEKLQGVVDNINSVLVQEVNLAANGFSKGTRLVELIDHINGLNNNNVITLSIVNREGEVITAADKEVQKLNIGDMFPGIYTLCRDKVGKDIVAKTDVEVVQKGEDLLYPTFKDAVWKRLVINSDVKKPYPIFADSIADLQAAVINMQLDSEFEFLKKVGLIDRMAVADDMDYEEVELEPFEVYKRLGKGFVKNAKIQETIKNGKPHYKVVQPAEDDSHRVVGINDGIYSILENHKSDYLVLAGVTAETKIENNLPRKEEFKISCPESIELVNMDNELNEVVLRAHCLMDAKDFNREIHYDLTVKDVDAMGEFTELFDQERIQKGLSKQRFLRMPVMNEKSLVESFNGIEDGLVVLVMKEDVNNPNKLGQLAKFNADKKMFELTEEDILGVGKESDRGYVSPKLLVQVGSELKIFVRNADGLYEVNDNPVIDQEAIDGATVDVEKDFIIASCGAVSNIYYVPLVRTTSNETSLYNALRDVDGGIQMDADGCVLTYKLSLESIAPIISLKDFAEEKLMEDEFTVVVAEADMPKLPFGENNDSNSVFIGIYSNELAFCSQEEMVSIFNNNSQLRHRFKFEVAQANNALDELPSFLNGFGLNKERDFMYDVDMYIPYSTTDNFARHLAQHCLYTQLKTYPTHGIIGCDKIAGINLSTIAERVDEVCNLDFDLYAKKDNGNYMFDSENQPYPLGRCVSITFIQYRGQAGSYNFVSNGAGGYAGMVSNLPAERSSTNQPIAIDQLGFELSNYQLGRLNTKGIVCAKTSTNNGVVIVDGITQAPKTSAYRRLATTKTINIVDRILKQTIEPYIGLVDSLATRNALNTAIKSALSGLVNVIINDFKFKISTDANEGALGIIRIDYVIIPCNEIREVRNRVEISDSLN